MSNDKRLYFYTESQGHVIEDGVIRNVSVMCSGEAKGKGMWVDDDFLKKIVEQGNAKPTGIKARLGHPKDGNDAIGSYIGRVKNFHMDVGRARGDLHLSQAAKKSPKGNLYDYVIELAANDPDNFGLSIAFDHDGFFNDDKGRRNVRLGMLKAVDVVDEPAANPEGLFDSDSQTVDDDKENAIKENKKMEKEEIKKWIAAFGAANASEYMAAGLTFESAQVKFEADAKTAEAEAMKTAIAERDAKIKAQDAQIAEMQAAMKAIEQKMSASAGASAVAANAPPPPVELTFEGVVKTAMAAGKSQFEAVRECANAHPDLHKVWMESKKSKYNTVI